jgi:acetyltransferase-like isoleucine patch superfamily enzyme
LRKTERYSIEGANSLWQIYKTISFWRVLKNTLTIEFARFVPFLKLKNWLYRNVLGMKIGDQTAIAYKVVFDLLYPEKIHIGRNTLIGYNTTILTHEYLTEEYRLGEVHIGDHVMIGANTTILPGVTIGDHAVIGAGSVVTKDIPPHTFAAGNPIRIIKERK